MIQLPDECSNPVVVHTGHADKSQVIKGFGPAGIVAVSLTQGTLCIDTGGVQVAVMIVIRQLVQPVDLTMMILAPTNTKKAPDTCNKYREAFVNRIPQTISTKLMTTHHSIMSSYSLLLISSVYQPRALAI